MHIYTKVRASAGIHPRLPAAQVEVLFEARQEGINDPAFNQFVRAVEFEVLIVLSIGGKAENDVVIATEQVYPF